MEMALSQLFFLASPDRLIIEPTGLGHPAEVLSVLASDAYRDRLELHTTVALVDARNMADDRHCKHPSFIQQLEIADVILANKADLATPSDLQRLSTYLEQLNLPIADLLPIEHGAMDLSILSGRSAWSPIERAHHHTDPDYVLAADLPMPACGFLRADNSGEGFESVGWRFSADKTFDYAKVVAFLRGVGADRIKAVLITDEGIVGFNVSGSAFSEVPIDDCLESRLEIISSESNPRWEQALLECVVTQ
jgi:G3E family GTPase